jgi:hypothetical protein
VWQQITQVPWSVDWEPTSQLKIPKSSKLILKLRLWNLLSVCDELFFRCNSHIKIQLYMCELSYLKKNCKISCWELCEQELLQVLCCNMFDSLPIC